MSRNSVYVEKGYESRRDYLEQLGEKTGVDLETVLLLADLLGPTEDFDGLVTGLQDFTGE